MKSIASLQDFYREMGFVNNNDLETILPDGINKEIGYFSLRPEITTRYCPVWLHNATARIGGLFVELL